MKNYELTWWNKKTYDEVCNFFDNGEKRCSITNATGSGKTSVVTAIIDKYSNGENSVLVICPRNNIIDQYKEYKLPENAVQFITYSKGGQLVGDNELQQYKNLSLIVCDEMHRTGAKTWFPVVEELVKLNPDAYVLGASATPKRLDQKDSIDDMVDILFNGNRAGNFDLITCLKSGILPKPVYVSAMYSMDEIFDSLEQKVMSKMKDDGSRLDIIEKIKESRINWEKSAGYGKVLADFLAWMQDGKNHKILIFCKGLKHIKEIRKNFDPVFNTIFDKPEIDEYHHNTSEKSFKRFRDSEDNAVQILYSVDKFNEGVHIDGLDAIIMLRDTESYIVYYQQVGRVLSLSGNKEPIIMDFVNNFKNVKANDFWKEILDVEEKLPSEQPECLVDQPRYKRDLKVAMYAVTKRAEEVFEDAEQRVLESMLYSYEGEKGTVKYFADKYKKNLSEIWVKVNKMGFSMREAILTSDDVIDRVVNWEGEDVPLVDLCKKLKKNPMLIEYRLNHGSTLAQALR